MDCIPDGTSANALLALAMIVQYVGCSYLVWRGLRRLRAPILRLLGDSDV